VGGVSAADEDIVRWNGGSSFELLFDGSDVGLSSVSIDAIAVIDANEILLSFAESTSISGLGVVENSDILLFSATSLGSATSGAFSIYLDGTDIGLTDAGENVDGLEYIVDSSAPLGFRVLISTADSFAVTGASGSDEDVFEFTPTMTGANTLGSSLFYFDGSDVGLTTSDVDGLARTASSLYVSLLNDASVRSPLFGNEDVLACIGLTTGSTTSCGPWNFFFDGSGFGIRGGNVNAIDLP
jgi:hypothetical protein